MCYVKTKFRGFIVYNVIPLEIAFIHVTKDYNNWCTKNRVVNEHKISLEKSLGGNARIMTKSTSLPNKFEADYQEMK